MTKWRTHIAQLDSRVQMISDEKGSHLRTIQELPTPPFQRQLTPEEWLFFGSLQVVWQSQRSAVELRQAFAHNWFEGRFIVCGLIARLMLEIRGLIEYTNANVLQKHTLDPAADAPFKRLERLLLGAKGTIKLPWGDSSSLPPINVMEFVRATDSEADYEWLCNAAHPGLMQHSYFYMAGPIGDNWTNATFAQHAVVELNRLLTIVEVTEALRLKASEDILQKYGPRVLHLE
jgi:hypothetical protein